MANLVKCRITNKWTKFIIKPFPLSRVPFSFKESKMKKDISFDYRLQVWVKNGIIQNCGHPESMRPGCCNGDRLKGLKVEDCGDQKIVDILRNGKTSIAVPD